MLICKLYQAAELINIDPVKEETQTVPQRKIQDHLDGSSYNFCDDE